MAKGNCILVGFFTIFTSCVGGGDLTSYDKTKKAVVIQTSSDQRSALPRAGSRSDLRSFKKDLRSEISDVPRNLKPLLNLSQVYLAEGKLKESEQLVRQALRIDLKNRGAKKIMAQIYMRRQNYGMATIILNGLGGVGSKDSEVLNMMALVAIGEKRNSDALTFFRRGLAVDPNNIAIRMNMGVLYVEYRQFKQATLHFERVLKFMPEHNDAKVHLAIIKVSKGDYSNAEDLYELILDRKKNNPLALYNLAVLRTQQKNFDEATKLLNKYLNTKYAGRGGNNDVYSLLKKIDARKKSNERRVSDDEIKSLTEKSKKKNQYSKKGSYYGGGKQNTEIDADEKALEDDLK